ncbi:MAG: LytTR family DNA-binding domain-containing protein [Bacteroidota bacterium]
MRKSVLIADDEEDARELLKVHLARHPQLALVAEAQNGQEALSLIDAQKPDIVLLDIQMPEMSGMEVVERLSNPPSIVFITAYDAFAVRAFELNAIDYLLKPFSQDRFDATISKVLASGLNSQKLEALMTSLSETLGSPSKYLRRFASKSGSQIVYIPVGEVVMIESADQYVEVHTSDAKHLLRLSMDYLESVLDPRVFFRSHRSYFVSIDTVTSIEQFEPRNYLIHLHSGLKARLARDKRDALNELLTLR